MASALKLKNDIRKLKTAIDNKGTNPKFLPKLKEQLAKLEDDLEKLKKPSKAGKKPYIRAEGSALTKLKNKLKGIEKKYSGYSGKTPLSLERDANQPAKPIGKRRAKSGNTYYEYRANRIDVNQPPKTYPKLEEGGYMDSGGKVYRNVFPTITFKTEEEASKFIKSGKPFLRKQLKEGKYYLVNNGEEFFIGEVREMASGGYMAKGREVTKGNLKIGDRIEAKGENWGVYVVKSLYNKNPHIWEIRNDSGERTLGEGELKFWKFSDKMEEGGYMAKGGKLSLKKFREKYDDNEDRNFHSENVVLLAENFGSESDIRDAKTILAKHEAIGSLPYNLSQERNALHDKLWAKYQEVVRQIGVKEDGGYMADGGEIKVGDIIELESGQKAKIIKVEDTWVSVQTTNNRLLDVYKKDVKKLSKTGQVNKSKDAEYASGGYMANGGELSSEDKVRLAQIEREIKEQQKTIEEFEEDDNETEYDRFGNPSPLSFNQQVVVAAENNLEKLQEERKNLLKGKKMADGGESQGYDDREDERLSMEHGKMSNKDFVGSHSEKEHSRRDDARFEERKMAMGGVAEHGLMKGDHIVDTLEDTLVIENGGKKYYVFIKTGEREEVAEKGGYMTHGGETHRSEKNKK